MTATPRSRTAGRAPDDESPPKPWDPPWRSRTAHRSCNPRAAAVLQVYRRTHGWTISEAARRSGVSRRMIGMLERAQRRPSISTAEALITAYGIPGGHAEDVRAVALPNVGRDSPYRTGDASPQWR
jgi:DNA-binding XRE family transcriptional regulator